MIVSLRVDLQQQTRKLRFGLALVEIIIGNVNLLGRCTMEVDGAQSFNNMRRVDSCLHYIIRPIYREIFIRKTWPKDKPWPLLAKEYRVNRTLLRKQDRVSASNRHRSAVGGIWTDDRSSGPRDQLRKAKEGQIEQIDLSDSLSSAGDKRLDIIGRWGRSGLIEGNSSSTWDKRDSIYWAKKIFAALQSAIHWRKFSFDEQYSTSLRIPWKIVRFLWK